MRDCRFETMCTDDRFYRLHKRAARGNEFHDFATTRRKRRAGLSMLMRLEAELHNGLIWKLALAS